MVLGKEGSEFFRSASNSSGKWEWKISDKKAAGNVNDETSISDQDTTLSDEEK
jgi:hypothetical protein